MDFSRHGWDKRGVIKCRVYTQGQMRMMGASPLVFGAIAALFGSGAMVCHLFVRPSSGVLISALAGLLHAAVFGGEGVWSITMRQRIKALKQADEVCAQLGIDEAELQRLAQEKNVKPRYVIDERDYYDPNDFTDAGILLRASTAPADNPHTLLHAAGGHNEMPPDQLLRASPPVEGSDSSNTSTLSVYATRRDTQNTTETTLRVQQNQR